jgi:uncharacterized protein YdiU (UPF0061 family)
MNTDNMAISGETIDYGPCAFMDEFSHNRVYSSIDRDGRYAYNNQPHIGQWNLVRLAETLLPLFIDTKISDEKEQGKQAVNLAQDLLNTYEAQYKTYWLTGMRNKLGLASDQNMSQETDIALIEDLLSCMESNQADFTLTFYYLSQLSNNISDADNDLIQLFSNPKDIKSWLKVWRSRLNKESSQDQPRQALMQSVNPVYIPRNHQIERAIRLAEDQNDFSAFHALHDVLQNPFEYQQGKESYMLPPRSDEVVHQTFCGT